jgi:hypothetical protein
MTRVGDTGFLGTTNASLSTGSFISAACSRRPRCDVRLDLLGSRMYFTLPSGRFPERPVNTNMHGGETVAGGTDDGGGRRRSLWKIPAFVTALILLIPSVGNHFVDGWNWDFGGFVLAGTFVFGTTLAYELVTRNVDRIAYRTAAGIALAAAFVLVWMNGVQAADHVNPAAVMYFGVPVLGIIGATMARLQPDGMARALFATALAQVSVLTCALMIRNPQVTPWTPAVLRGFGLNAFLVMLFFGSALLFRKAAPAESTPGSV